MRRCVNITYYEDPVHFNNWTQLAPVVTQLNQLQDAGKNLFLIYALHYIVHSWCLTQWAIWNWKTTSVRKSMLLWNAIIVPPPHPLTRLLRSHWLLEPYIMPSVVCTDTTKMCPHYSSSPIKRKQGDSSELPRRWWLRNRFAAPGPPDVMRRRLCRGQLIKQFHRWLDGHSSWTWGERMVRTHYDIGTHAVRRRWNWEKTAFAIGDTLRSHKSTNVTSGLITSQRWLNAFHL